MEQPNPPPPVRESLPAAQSTPDDPAVLDIIRTETVFSRMPMHILSKSGRQPSINIEKRTPDGKLHEKWEVTYNKKYGDAGQLAYDVHTLLVERAIEEAFEECRCTGQSLPRLISLGSLHEMARKLGIAEGGSVLNKIKRAMFQNATLAIHAFKKFRGNDGTEHTIEGVFSPYGVFLLGQKLPDGRTADTVYANLNDPYFEAWSTAPTRPLDYAYKAQLPPAARRFYELVSFSIYGALKNGQPVAAYRYSDYCDRVPQLRYEMFDQVKKQMYKIHRPHLKSGYLEGVQYQHINDEQGRADWLMLYTPGPKAKVEYATFTGKKPRTLHTTAAAPHLPAGKSTSPLPAARQPRQHPLNLQPAAEPAAPATIDYRQVAELAKRGVEEAGAHKLVAELPASYPLLDTLEWADEQIARQPGKFNNPPGFYISLLQARTTPPPTFQSSAARKAQEEASLQQQQARQEQAQRRQAEEEARDQEASRQLAQMEATEYDRWQALYNQAKEELFNNPIMARRKNQPAAWHDGAIRGRMKKLLPEFLHQATNSVRAESRPFDLQALLTTLQIPLPDPTATQQSQAVEQPEKPRH